MAVLVQFSEGHHFKDWAPILEQLNPRMELRNWPDFRQEEDIEAAIIWRHYHGTLNKFPNLKVICNVGAGVEHVLEDHDLPSGVPITRVIDRRMTNTMSEYIILHVLRHHRHFEETLANQETKTWAYKPPDNATATTVGIMGLGELGLDAARKLSALGFRVAGWSRTAKQIEGLDSYEGSGELKRFLCQCDILICLLPLTEQTEGILNTKTFFALPKGAYIINAARGQHLVEDNLISALDDGHLAGATLDVFQTEPLPEDHPFWTHPRVTITPHNAADSFPEDVAPQLVENIRRALAGEDLLNVIDVGRGY